jgi:radical SAM-linked protein
MTRTLKSAFTAAGISVSLSGETRPQPQIAFGPALPVNVESREEWLDFFTFRYVSPREFLSKINGVLPPELHFVQMGPISKTAPSLSAVINGADYSLRLRDPASSIVLSDYSLRMGISESKSLLHALSVFDQKKEVRVVKHKNEKVVNVKDYVGSFDVDDSKSVLWIEMKIVDGITVGIHYVLGALFETEVELPVCRERLYVWDSGEKQSPLALEWEQIQTQRHVMDLAQ